MRIGRGFIASYGLAHFGKSLFWHSSELLFAYVLTEVWRIPPYKAGVILAMSLLLSAGLDILAGRLFASSILTARSAARAQWWGTIACGVMFSAFGLAGYVSLGERFAVVMIGLSAFRVAYAFVDNPQNAVLVLATHDDRSRTVLASTRYIAGGLASVAITAAIAPFLSDHHWTNTLNLFAWFTAIVSAVAVISAGLLKAAAPVSEIGSPAKPLCDSPLITSGLRKTTGRYSVFIAMFAVSAGMSVFGRLEPYYVAYGFTLNGTTLLVCVAAGTVVSQPAWVRLSRRLSLVWTLRAAALSIMAGALAFSRVASANAAAVVLSGIVYGAGCGGVLMSLWALAAKTADFSSAATGATGTVARLTFSAKIGLAVAAYTTGAILDTNDYRSAIDAAVLPLMTLAPVVGVIICLVASIALPANASTTVNAPPAHLFPPPREDDF